MQGLEEGGRGKRVMGDGDSGVGALLPLDSVGHVEQIVQPVEAEAAVRVACDPFPVM